MTVCRHGNCQSNELNFSPDNAKCTSLHANKLHSNGGKGANPSQDRNNLHQHSPDVTTPHITYKQPEIHIVLL